MNKLWVIFGMLPLGAWSQFTTAIIPKPVHMEIHAGSFVMDATTAIQYSSKEGSLQSAAHFFKEAIQGISGIQLRTQEAAPKKIELLLQKDSLLGTEGYRLQVSPSAIMIRATTKSGIIYGMQTILQTLPAIRTNAVLQVPCMSIVDYPKFSWRGMHLDVSRHFFGPEVVKSYIDLMAAYKMNTFHWHLVDDQGWRIEIKKFPNLTSVGAWRVDKTDQVWGSRPVAKSNEIPNYGGYYTQKQLKEIVAYAAERNITIVPEIEMPGHVASAIASYPYLSCSQKEQLPLTGGNYKNAASNYCAGNEKVFSFVEDVLTEVIKIFPSPYIHVGGDEVDKSPWKHCAKCQQRIQQEGLKDENGLQSYFIKRIEKFLVSKHKKLIGWDEILEGGLAPEATVMSWRGEAGGIEAAKMHHNVIMTPGNPCYFDQYQAGPEGEPVAIGGFNPLQKVYQYEPIPAELNALQSKYVLGAQGNVWTEYITTPEHLEYMVLPRMQALAEVLWTPSQQKSWIDFNTRLQTHFNRWQQKGIRYCEGNFTVSILPQFKNGELTATLNSEIPQAVIHYTLDGTEPTLQSEIYAQPLPIRTSGVLKASLSLNDKMKGVQAAQQAFMLHNAVGASIHYTNSISKYYQANGDQTLLNGIRGNFSIGKHWQGINEKDLQVVIDLGIEKDVQDISIGFLQKYNDWIFLPGEVLFEGSTDGLQFTHLGTTQNKTDRNTREIIKDFSVALDSKKLRYIRVTAKNGRCPEGHSGAGQPAWLFADEIIIR